MCVCVCVRAHTCCGVDFELGLELGNGKTIAFDSKLEYGLCVCTLVFMCL